MPGASLRTETPFFEIRKRFKDNVGFKVLPEMFDEDTSAGSLRQDAMPISVRAKAGYLSNHATRLPPVRHLAVLKEVKVRLTEKGGCDSADASDIDCRQDELPNTLTILAAPRLKEQETHATAHLIRCRFNRRTCSHRRQCFAWRVGCATQHEWPRYLALPSVSGSAPSYPIDER